MSGVKVSFLQRHAILPRLMTLAQRLLSSREKVLELSLFPSLARGNYAPGSDADILILFKNDPRRFADRIPEFLDFFSGISLSVEVFPYTLEEIATKKDERFLKGIQKGTMVLASRSNHGPG